jgi:hypothetical protein
MAPMFTWFKEDPLPDLPIPSIVVGGTRLLKEFLAIVASVDTPSSLAIAAPFVGLGIRDEIGTWSTLPHELLDLRLVTRSRRDSEVALSEVGRLPWRSLHIVTWPRLHAKLYAVLDAKGGGAALVGSHNLTPGGAHTNHEAGVLFNGGRDREVGQIVRACHDQIILLGRRGLVQADSLRWCGSNAA